MGARTEWETFATVRTADELLAQSLHILSTAERAPVQVFKISSYLWS